MSFSNDRVIAETILKYSPFDKTKDALELGCAPGKWMVFLNQKCGFRVDGIEYVKAAADTTRNNLEINGIADSHVYEGDFMTVPIGRKYDTVLSLGFLEHFENPKVIMRKSLELLKSRGRVIIGVPNFRGINYCIAKYLDSRKNLLSNHNIKVMDLGFFKKQALDYGLKIDYCGYLGGFEPALFDISSHSYCMRVILAVIFRFLRAVSWNPVMKPFFSGYMLAVYTAGK